MYVCLYVGCVVVYVNCECLNMYGCKAQCLSPTICFIRVCATEGVTANLTTLSPPPNSRGLTSTEMEGGEGAAAVTRRFGANGSAGLVMPRCGRLFYQLCPSRGIVLMPDCSCRWYVRKCVRMYRMYVCRRACTPYVCMCCSAVVPRLGRRRDR
ncbi:hypothetical protein V8C37DRAFT_368276 [Trichoderma ceciliae]